MSLTRTMKDCLTLCLCLCLCLCLPPCTSLGRHSGLGASEVCEVNSRTKVSHHSPPHCPSLHTGQVSEGYHVAGGQQCNTFCKMTRGCQWWTWYRHVTQDEVTKVSITLRCYILLLISIRLQDNVCFALTSCELVTQKCQNCSSGKKVDINL